MTDKYKTTAIHMGNVNVMLTAISASVRVFSLLWLGVGELPPARRDPGPPFFNVLNFSKVKYSF